MIKIEFIAKFFLGYIVIVARFIACYLLSRDRATIQSLQSMFYFLIKPRGVLEIRPCVLPPPLRSFPASVWVPTSCLSCIKSQDRCMLFCLKNRHAQLVHFRVRFVLLLVSVFWVEWPWACVESVLSPEALVTAQSRAARTPEWWEVLACVPHKMNTRLQSNPLCGLLTQRDTDSVYLKFPLLLNR